jgi:hypothetical protein
MTNQFIMYAGYVLFCNSASQEQCLRLKLYTCADRITTPMNKVKKGSVIFLYNTETKILLGPFTAASEGGRTLESGAWAVDIDEHSASENVKVEWEELHQIENAPEKLPFLNNSKTCVLSETQTQRALDILKQAPVYTQ